MAFIPLTKDQWVLCQILYKVTYLLLPQIIPDRIEL